MSDLQRSIPEPRISVLMPVRNAAPTLRLAIRSILWQTLQDWELLIFDDGSTDDTVAIASQFRDPRISVVHDGRNLGLAARLNQAMDMAKGHLLARMDGDDLAFRDRLQAQADEMDKNPRLDLLGTGTVVFDSSGHALGRHAAPLSHEAICARPLSGFRLSHPTWMGRREWFLRFRYRPEQVKAQDQDLLLRAYRTSRFRNLPGVYLGYREQELSLRKIWKGRRYWIGSLVREFNRPGTRLPMVAGVTGQILKGAVDLAAITSGLRYRVLRHRALPLSAEEQQRWDEAWQAANKSGEGMN